MNELTINLDSRSKKPLYEQIYDYIKSDIQNGRIPYGEKLPSTRALAKYLEVSRSTVELAYEQLLSTFTFMGNKSAVRLGPKKKKQPRLEL